MIELNGKRYEVVENIKNGFQKEDIENRYSDILKKYDYIVGDWGYSQLRLKGFYDEDHVKASFETTIDTLDDYLYVYCNFGCAYFVLRKLDNYMSGEWILLFFLCSIIYYSSFHG